MLECASCAEPLVETGDSICPGCRALFRTLAAESVRREALLEQNRQHPAYRAEMERK